MIKNFIEDHLLQFFNSWHKISYKSSPSDSVKVKIHLKLTYIKEYFIIHLHLWSGLRTSSFLIDRNWDAVRPAIFSFNEYYFRILQGIPPRASNACFIERLVYSRCRRRTHARNPGIWSPVPARLPNRNSRRILMGPIPKRRAHVSRCLAWP